MNACVALGYFVRSKQTPITRRGLTPTNVTFVGLIFFRVATRKTFGKFNEDIIRIGKVKANVKF